LYFSKWSLCSWIRWDSEVSPIMVQNPRSSSQRRIKLSKSET
jgi:hypothetical protein